MRPALAALLLAGCIPAIVSPNHPYATTVARCHGVLHVDLANLGEDPHLVSVTVEGLELANIRYQGAVDWSQALGIGWPMVGAGRGLHVQLSAIGGGHDVSRVDGVWMVCAPRVGADVEAR